MLVSEEEYLHTSYEPDCDFEDGVLIERNVGLECHSRSLAFVGSYFVNRSKLWNIRAYISLRFKCRAGKYMVADLSVVPGRAAREAIPTQAPLIWIEILSPEDRRVTVTKKIIDALAFGTPYVWVIDSETLESELHTSRGTAVLQDGILRIPGTEIVVPLQEVVED